MEDGRWEEEGHGPVVVVVGEIDCFFFQLLMVNHFFGASTTNTLYYATWGVCLFCFPLPILLANETSAIAFEYIVHM